MRIKRFNGFFPALLLTSSLSIPFNLSAENATIKSLFELSLAELLSVKVSTGQRSSATSYRDLPVPIHVITQAELRRSGYTELGKVLQRFEIAFNFPRTHITDLSDGVRPGSLRGLSPSHTLILVNGRRLHDSAVLHLNNSMGRGATSADINTIPIVAISKIEILKDGAAAQYGSDAIAGVINIILDQQAGKQVTVTHGQTKIGDGEVDQLDFRYGQKFAAGGSWQASFEMRERESTNRSEVDVRQQYFDGDPRNDTNPVNGQVYGDPETSDRLFWLNGDYQLFAHQTFYFTSGLNQRDVISNGFFRRPQDNRNVRSIYPDGYLPEIVSHSSDWHTSLGLRSSDRPNSEQWAWDLSLSSGKNSLLVDVENSVNVSLGLDSPTEFFAGELISRLSSVNFELTKKTQWNQMPFDILLGSEWRNDGYQTKSGEENSYIHGGIQVLDGPNAGATASAGSQVFPGFKPENEIDVSRNSLAVFAESKLKLNEAVLLQAAIRAENYADFGKNFDSKLAIAYSPNKKWLFRGSASTGFRAPSIAQSSYRATSTSFFDNEAADVGTFGVDEPVAIALGATPLKPEKSQQTSFGLAFLGSQSVTFNFDAFSTKIKDRIVLSGAITRDAALFGQTVVDILNSYNVGGARFFSNAVDTETVGYDLGLKYDFQLANGNKLNFAFNYHHNDSKITGGPRTPALFEESVDVLFDRREQLRLVEGQPGDNLSLNLRYIGDAMNLEIRQYRFGSFKTGQRNNDASLDFTYGAKWVTDLHIDYQLEKNLQFSLGGHNIFDETPDYRNEVPSSLFGEGKILPYHQLSPFGFNGAYYYIKLNYGF